MGLKEFVQELADAPKRAINDEAVRYAGLTDYERGIEDFCEYLDGLMEVVETAAGDDKAHVVKAVRDLFNTATAITLRAEDDRLAKLVTKRADRGDNEETDEDEPLTSRIHSAARHIKDLLFEAAPLDASMLQIVLNDELKDALIRLYKHARGDLAIRNESGPFIIADDVKVYGESDLPKQKGDDLDVMRLSHRIVFSQFGDDNKLADRHMRDAGNMLDHEAARLGAIQVTQGKLDRDGLVCPFTDYTLLVAVPGDANAKAVEQRVNDRQNAIIEFRNALRTEARLLSQEDPLCRRAGIEMDSLIEAALRKMGEAR